MPKAVLEDLRKQGLVEYLDTVEWNPEGDNGRGSWETTEGEPAEETETVTPTQPDEPVVPPAEQEEPPKSAGKKKE